MADPIPPSIEVIDSHTGGEPTRVVVSGGPGLGAGPMAERLAVLRDRHDWLRSVCCNEPRGSETVVGALLCEPVSPDASAGVIFFNNVGYLRMCGHGTIGLAVTLAHLDLIQPGQHMLETPAGPVGFTLHQDGQHVSVQNVSSYRSHHRVALEIDGLGTIHGDLVWGGNWFFLVSDHGQRVAPDNIETLTRVAWAIRRAVNASDVADGNGAKVDHIELVAPPSDPNTADAQCFVLCPGGAYDRSPCGTGTSAKLACLAADGKLGPGEVWRQQSVIGSVFEASYETDPRSEGHILPTITGNAFVTARASLLIDPADPIRLGLQPH